MNTKKEKFLNCFYDLTSGKKYSIPKQNFLNFYLKIKFSELTKFDLKINTKNLILEIISLDFKFFNYKIFQNIFKKQNIKKIILNYKIFSIDDIKPKNKNFQIINQLKKLNFKDIGIDFYIGNINWSFSEKLKIFLKKYKNIKHFSIYLIDDNFSGINLKDNFLNFTKYHLHMWSSNEKYKSFYGLEILKYKNYLGISKKAISRKKDNFYKFLVSKNNWKLKKIKNISKKFIEFSDHISRLEFYKLIQDDEWKTYRQISKKKYETLLKERNNNLVIVHDLLIYELTLNNLNS